MSQYFNTLYVTEPESYLHKDHETVVVRIQHETKLQVPLHHLISIVCIGPEIGVSPELMRACMEAKIGISFLSATGRFQGRVEGRHASNVLVRREQYRQADQVDKCLEYSRSFLIGKVANARTLVGRMKRENGSNESTREAFQECFNRLKANIAHIRQSNNLESLRGFEGEAAAIYFSKLGLAIKNDDFGFEGRVRRPPRDPVNALLSFLYTILNHDCAGALAAAGLDPQVGFLHTDRPGRPSLALDLMEEFRPVFVDRLVLRLLNLKQLTAKDFKEDMAGGIKLKEDARKLVLIEYQKSKKEEIFHPLLKSTIPFALLPHLQARLLAKTIRGELVAYPPFVLR
ncbi:MAG: type I-C CRISPR-associated endonuclease Cas1c [Candidatus Caenarcaniphilales bacterium]|nr:type I-C CRISPR-associated endonuclease Cas1c [Candidatus Caenarcaniphilales bacterium]